MWHSLYPKHTISTLAQGFRTTRPTIRRRLVAHGIKILRHSTQQQWAAPLDLPRRAPIGKPQSIYQRVEALGRTRVEALSAREIAEIVQCSISGVCRAVATLGWDYRRIYFIERSIDLDDEGEDIIPEGPLNGRTCCYPGCAQPLRGPYRYRCPEHYHAVAGRISPWDGAFEAAPLGGGKAGRRIGR